MGNSNTAVKYQSTLFVSLVMLFACAAVTLNMFKVPTMIGTVSAEMGMADPSILMSVFTFVGIIFAVPSSLVIDKFGAKAMCVAACLMVGAGSIIGGVANIAGLLTASRALEGLGYILITVAAPVTVSIYVHPRDVGLGVGIFCMWVPLGQIIANNLTRPLAGSMGWRGVWMAYAAVAIVLGLAMAALIKKPQGLPAPEAPQAQASAEPGTAGAQEKSGVAALLANKNYVLVVLALMIFNYMLIQLLSYIPSFALETGLMEAKEAGFAGSVPMICALAGCPICGKISDKIGRKKVLILALIAATAGIVITFSGSRTGVYVGGILFGLVGLATPGSVYAAIPGMVGAKLNSLATGIASAVGLLGQFLATAIFGALLGVAGGSYIVAVAAVVIPIGIVAVVFAGIAKVD